MINGQNVYLIGMMGSGKTTLGKLLANQLNYKFADTDALVEADTKQTVAQIFADVGEVGFRQIEHKILAEVATNNHFVIATGGGIVLNSANWTHLKNGITIWLDLAPDQLYQRLRSSHQVRPLLATPDPLSTLRDIYSQRHRLYAQANLRVPIDCNDSPQKASEQLFMALVHKFEQNLEFGNKSSDKSKLS